MSKKLLTLIIALVLVVGTAVIVYASAGDSSDPLVTKSYVDQKVAAVQSSSGNTYQVVHMTAGQSLIGGAGTEIIVRSGQASVIATGSNGVSDITGGKDLSNGTTATANHLLLTPRDDGRGIKAKSEVYVMVRGEYTLK